METDKMFRPGDCVVSKHSTKAMKVKMYVDDPKRGSVMRAEGIPDSQKQVVLCIWKDHQGKDQSREYKENELRLCDEETQRRMD